MFKQTLPGLYFLLGLCATSALIQTAHLIDTQRIFASGSAPNTPALECIDFGPVIRPSR